MTDKITEQNKQLTNEELISFIEDWSDIYKRYIVKELQDPELWAQEHHEEAKLQILSLLSEPEKRKGKVYHDIEEFYKEEPEQPKNVDGSGKEGMTVGEVFDREKIEKIVESFLYFERQFHRWISSSISDKIFVIEIQKFLDDLESLRELQEKK